MRRQDYKQYISQLVRITHEREVNMESLVDIFIVTHNRADYLPYSIQSVLCQSYREFNLYILDNCSTDNTQELVRSFQDKRLHYIHHERNLGGLGNINYAYTHAKSKYYVVFHDDDVMKPNFIEKELQIMELHPEYAMVSCKADIIDENGDRVRNYKKKEVNIDTYKGNEFFCAYLYQQKFITFPSIMYRRTFCQKAGILLKEGAGPSADVLVSMDIERYGGIIAVINEALMDYRNHAKQDSQLHRIEMMEKLFSYLKNDQHYAEVLKKHTAGQHKFFKWLMHGELCMAAGEKITWSNAAEAKRVYEGVLDTTWKEQCLYGIALHMVHWFPRLMKQAYLVGKKYRGRNDT